MTRDPDSQGARDAATVLPFATAILLMPPVILIFAVPALVGALPLIVVYIFGLWGAVIVAALLLARRLPRPEANASADRPPEAD